MRLLGISAFYHDSAAALVEDGHIVAAAQEERFTRKKHDARFPAHAIRYCLDAGKVDLDRVDHVIYFEKPLIKFERLLETYLASAPRGFPSFRMAIPLWIKEKLFQKPNLEKALRAFARSGKVDGKLLFAEHHQSHAASAFFHNLFGGFPRDPETPLAQRHMDLAASVQKVTEGIMLRITRNLARTYQLDNLCLAGGVALNCVANGKILRDGSFKRIWVQPAAGDAGGALGAALAAHYQHCGQARRTNGCLDGMQGSYLGPEFSQAEIEKRLGAAGAKFTVIDEPELFERTCDAVEAGHAVGWFQGRMEFGPRALGARSILGDPRNPNMQKVLNLKVKYRESFRPFAPSVLREDVADYFELDADSPYMLLVADVKRNRRRAMTGEQERLFGIDRLNVARSDIPAVTHIDYSARIQTVHAETNPRYHALLSAFKRRTGFGVLVNTSFNVRGEPIVCTPEDAFRCFMGTEIETLVAGNCFLHKDDQNRDLAHDYKQRFESD